MDKYIPVSCQLHSELELAIMHNKKLKINVNKSSENSFLTIKPYDVITKDKCEFLLGKDSEGNAIDIRLDQIRAFQILP